MTKEVRDGLSSTQASSRRAARTSSAGGAAIVRAADLDGDGLKDVLVAEAGDDAVMYYAWAGDAWATRVVSSDVSAAVSVAAADLDGDSDLDVVSAEQTLPGAVAWHENGGDCAAGAPTSAPTSAPADSPAYTSTWQWGARGVRGTCRLGSGVRGTIGAR